MNWEYNPILNEVTGVDNGNCRVRRAIPYGSTPEEVIQNGHKIAAVHDLYAVAVAVLDNDATIEMPVGLVQMAMEALRKADNTQAGEGEP